MTETKKCEDCNNCIAHAENYITTHTSCRCTWVKKREYCCNDGLEALQENWLDWEDAPPSVQYLSKVIYVSKESLAELEQDCSWEEAFDLATAELLEFGTWLLDDTGVRGKKVQDTTKWDERFLLVYHGLNGTDLDAYTDKQGWNSCQYDVGADKKHRTFKGAAKAAENDFNRRDAGNKRYGCLVAGDKGRLVVPHLHLYCPVVHTSRGITRKLKNGLEEWNQLEQHKLALRTGPGRRPRDQTGHLEYLLQGGERQVLHDSIDGGMRHQRVPVDPGNDDQEEVPAQLDEPEASGDEEDDSPGDDDADGQAGEADDGPVPTDKGTCTEEAMESGDEGREGETGNAAGTGRGRRRGRDESESSEQSIRKRRRAADEEGTKGAQPGTSTGGRTDKGRAGTEEGESTEEEGGASERTRGDNGGGGGGRFKQRGRRTVIRKYYADRHLEGVREGKGMAKGYEAKEMVRLVYDTVNDGTNRAYTLDKFNQFLLHTKMMSPQKLVELQNKDKYDKTVINCMNVRASELMDQKWLEALREIELYDDDVEEYWFPEEAYWSTEESTYIILKMLMDWVGSDRTTLWTLIKKIQAIIDKKQEKVNTIMMRGPPNSGKTKLLDSIKDAFIHIGTLKNLTREEQFPCGDCERARVITGNELRIDEAKGEFALQLMEGDKDMAINVKYHSNKTLPKTPVILTGNDDPWLRCVARMGAMKKRMLYLRAHSNPEYEFLLKKKLHPRGWQAILQIVEKCYGARDAYTGKIPTSSSDWNDLMESGRSWYLLQVRSHEEDLEDARLSTMAMADEDEEESEDDMWCKENMEDMDAFDIENAMKNGNMTPLSMPKEDETNPWPETYCSGLAWQLWEDEHRRVDDTS